MPDNKHTRSIFQKLVEPSNISLAVFLIFLKTAWILLLLCIGPSPVGEDYSCRENLAHDADIQGIGDVLAIVSSPFGMIFAWTIGDTGPSIILGFVLVFLLALLCALFLRWGYHKLKQTLVRSADKIGEYGRGD